MRNFSVSLLLIAALLAVPLPALAEGSRTYSNAHRPYRLLAKQFAAGANVFTIVDPSPAGTPLTLSSATAMAPVDGVVSFGMQAGFTPPVTLTGYSWQADEKGTGQAGWVRCDKAAAGYAQAVDTNYAIVSFSFPGNTPILVMSSAAVTGLVYCSAPATSQNPGSSATGY